MAIRIVYTIYLSTIFCDTAKLLDYDGSISEQKKINGREFEVISKDYIRLLELFDDVICEVKHDR